jgi:hypothetical protein
MPHDVIDAELSAADLASILDHLHQARALMPFVVDLSPQQRRRLFKLGPGSLAFARDAYTVARQYEDIMPRNFDVDEFERDLNLSEQLDQILISIERLRESVDDTRRQVGSETMRHARLVYRQVQNSPGGNNLDAVAAQLGQRFARQGRRGNNGSNGNSGGEQ